MFLATDNSLIWVIIEALHIFGKRIAQPLPIFLLGLRQPPIFYGRSLR